MEKSTETNLALFIDFDNIALGARDAGVRFDIQLLLQRLLERGKILVKKAYADWSHHKEYMTQLHEAVVELIEIPRPRLSGKNSADIRLAVDAMDLCHGNEHIGSFVIVSGDSDFSPLVSKLRENNKSVLGVGMRNSSSQLLIANCDEFILYDDLAEQARGDTGIGLDQVPEEKREIFDVLLGTTQGLMRDGWHTLYSSLIKDTIKRKQPDFNESNYGYSTFGDLLEDAMAHGLMEVTRDEASGGTWVVTSLTPAVDRTKRQATRGTPARRPAKAKKPAAKRTRSTTRRKRPARSK
jgi:uncharacterized protein (TIGR00288 family)